MLVCLLLCFSIFTLLFKSSLFHILVLLEVLLMVTIFVLMCSTVSTWWVLPLIGLGACESSLGLALSVWLSRTVPIQGCSL